MWLSMTRRSAVLNSSECDAEWGRKWVTNSVTHCVVNNPYTVGISTLSSRIFSAAQYSSVFAVSTSACHYQISLQ